MDKGVYFKDNTYGPAGLAGPAHATTIYEYGNWDQWAQTPAGNIAERNEGISNYAKSVLTLSSLHLGAWHPGSSAMIKQPPRGLLQKTQTTKFPDLAVVARTPFWSFCAGQRRIGPGQITDGT